jgi:hypothetical protein
MATIVCDEPTILAVIDKSLYDHDFKASLRNYHISKIKFLQSVPVFAKWTRTTLAKFSYFMTKT